MFSWILVRPILHGLNSRYLTSPDLPASFVLPLKKKKNKKTKRNIKREKEEKKTHTINQAENYRRKVICKEATLLVEVLNEAVKRYRQVIGNEEDNLKHDLEDGIVFFSPLPSPLSPLPSPLSPLPSPLSPLPL